MDKSLLIHSDNTPKNVQNYFDNKNIINFNYDNNQHATIDEYISKVIIEELKSKNFDLIYIKDSLSSNYLELYGLLVAYHIRLSQELKHKRYIPIVILSDIDGFTLNQIVPMAKIFFSKNIFLERNNKETIVKYQQKNISLLTDKEYSNFLNSINLDAPENSSNHSITNEWAIYRWAEFLKVDSEAIQNNKEKIASMLYFKYLLAKNPILKNSATSSCVYPVSTGNILYIDDEYDKGWSYILKNYFEENSKTNFYTFKHNFKNENVNTFTLLRPIKEKILSCNPDVIILDLRLTQNDKSNEQREDVNNFSGIKIRQLIKEINPAIQVIMFTATSKSVILDKLYEHNILGYIKKEHPEDKNLTTSENFTKLARLTSEGFEKSYLKEIWEIQKYILNLNIFQVNNKEYNVIRDEVNTIFEILNSNLENRMKFTVVTLFKILEILLEKYSINDRGTYPKIISLFKKFNLFNYNNDISAIICTRNYLTHAGDFRKPCEKSVVKNPNKNHILTWFKMLETILKKIDEVVK